MAAVQAHRICELKSTLHALPLSLPSHFLALSFARGPIIYCRAFKASIQSLSFLGAVPNEKRDPPFLPPHSRASWLLSLKRSGDNLLGRWTPRYPLIE